MYQVYFLSIVANLLAGLALAFDRMEDRLHLRAVFNPDLFRNVGFRLSLGVATFGIGFAKLLSVSAGDVPVVGDLFPALIGLVMGFILVFQYYQQRTTIQSSTVESIDRVFGRHAATFGVVGLLVAVAHFFVPNFLFL